MGKILEAFLTDQLHMDNVIGQQTPEHQRLYEMSDELQDKLAKKLNAEDKAILTELVDNITSAGCYDAEAKLQCGFRLGVLMITEIFMEQNMFFRTDNDCA